MISALKDRLNFSIQFIPVEDQRFGGFSEKLNDWDGIVGMTKRNEIDTSPMHLSITPERSTAIVYSTPVIQLRSYLFLQKPRPSFNWHTFSSVFDTAYWLAIVASILIFAGAYTFFIFWLYYIMHIKSENNSWKH